MKRISGMFVGTGAILNLAIGFKPDRVLVRNISSATLEGLEWSTAMRQIAVTGGLKTTSLTDNGTASLTSPAKVALAAGISHYDGGTPLTAASTSVLVADPASDKRDAGTLGTVNKWTITTAANRTGKFNTGVNTTYVGVGSRVGIRDMHGVVKYYTILAITNDGDANDEVTLNTAASTGEVVSITGMYDFIGATAGTIPPDGFTIAADTDVNVSGEVCYFEADLND